jgi:hypothetical protein
MSVCNTRELRSVLISVNVASEEVEELNGCEGSQMLRKLSENVAHCYRHAEECRRKAEDAFTDEMREDFLRLEQSWLNLAHSYEFAERLIDFSKDNKQRRAEFYEDDPSRAPN